MLAQYSIVHVDSAVHYKVQYSYSTLTVQYSTVQYMLIIQYSTVFVAIQYSTVYVDSTVQYSIC